jgi:hypothetical protein
VLVLKSLLDGVQRAARQVFAWTCEALDRRHLVAVGLGRQDRAGLHRDAVERHRAGAALRSVAADVRAGEPQLIAEEVNEKGAGGNGGAPPYAVDLKLD